MGSILEYVNVIAVPGISAMLLALLFRIAGHYVQKVEDDRLRALLVELVKAAEQIYGKANGEAKLKYVQEQASLQGYSGVKRETIEAAVYDLRVAEPAK